MKTSAPLRAVAAALLLLAASIGISLSPANAAPSPSPTPSVIEPLATAEREPVASLERETLTADALEIEPLSLSQCSSGYFCVWSQSYYTGTLQRFRTTGQLSSIVLSRVGSFYNNRSTRAYVYESDGNGSIACYKGGYKRATTSGWLTRAENVYLSTISSC